MSDVVKVDGVDDIRAAYSKGLAAWKHISKALTECFDATNETFLPALKNRGVGIIMLEHLDAAMQAVGDILSNMDAVEVGDEEATDKAFKAVSAILRPDDES